MEKENIEKKDIFDMFRDTSNLLAEIQVYNQVENLTTRIEFNKWMNANYTKNFPNTETIKEQALNNTDWVKLQFQGKGYEFDFMVYQRGKFSNISSTFNAGNNPTQVGIDITKRNIFTNKIEDTFQNKAYLSETNPKLKNTPKDAIVVVPPEKVEYIKKQGYKVEEFMTKDEISKQREIRFNEAVNGKAELNYNLKNVSSTMGKAGLAGFAIGMGIETIASYKKWKNKEITTEKYIQEILKTGAQLGINSGVTAGLMIPVSAKLIVLGASKLINIPVAICISTGLDKILSPIFKKGEYKKCLVEAKYYQSMSRCYENLGRNTVLFQNTINSFVEEIYKLNNDFIKIEKKNIELKKENEKINKEMLEIYNLI